MIRTWIVEAESFEGWYVNLERPWTRTAVGFDSRDDVFDITVSPDLGDWRLKDDDELDFAVEVGLFTLDEAVEIRASAASAVDDIVNRRWPFDDATWDRVLPQQLLEPSALPVGWESD